jgi:hypothetical protein
MRTLNTLLPAVALAAGLIVASGANAAVTISIGTSVGAGSITTQATGVVTPGQQVHAGGFTVGGYTVTSIDGTYDVLPDILSGDSINLNGGATGGPLNIFVTISGLDASALSAGELISTFSTSKAPAGTVLSTFFDAANGIFSKATALQSVTVSGLSSSAGGNVIAHPAGPFSLTEEFQVSGSGTFNGGADISAAPEPAAWAMMLVGFGGLGAMLRSNRRRNVALTA